MKKRWDKLRHPTPQTWAYLIVILLPALVFARILGFEFLNWDDPHLLTEHHWFLNLNFKSVLAMFNPLSFWQGQNLDYSPLRDLSYALDLVLWGWSSAGFHFAQLILHCLNAGLVLTLFRRRLSLFYATCGALIFALHPLVVEPVAWLASRKDLLMLCGFLLVLLWTEKERPYRATCAGIGSLLAKYTAAILGPAILVLQWLERKRIPWKTVISLTLAALALGIFVIAANRHVGRLPQTTAGSGLVEMWPAALQVITHNVSKLFWPANLSAIYVADPILHLYRPTTLIIGAGLLLAILAAIFYGRLRWPALSYGLALFLLGMLPNFMQIAAKHPLWMADRYMYLPLVGAGLALAACAEQVARRQKKLIAVLLVLILLALGTKSFLRLPVWHDSYGFWQETLKHKDAQQEAVAWGSFGLAQFAEGKFEQAVSSMEKSLSKKPGWHELWFWLVRARLKTGDREGAQALMKRIAPLEREMPAQKQFSGALEQAIARMELNDLLRAEELLNQYLRIMPYSPRGWGHLGLLYEKTGRQRKAFWAYQRGIGLWPSLSVARLGRARYYLQQDRCRLVVRELAALGRLMPAEQKEKEELTKACAEKEKDLW